MNTTTLPRPTTPQLATDEAYAGRRPAHRPSAAVADLRHRRRRRRLDQRDGDHSPTSASRRPRRASTSSTTCHEATTTSRSCSASSPSPSLFVAATGWKRWAEQRAPRDLAARTIGTALAATATINIIFTCLAGSMALYLPGGTDEGWLSREGIFVNYTLLDFGQLLGWWGAVVAAVCVATLSLRRNRVLPRWMGVVSIAPAAAGARAWPSSIGLPGLRRPDDADLARRDQHRPRRSARRPRRDRAPSPRLGRRTGSRPVRRLRRVRVTGCLGSTPMGIRVVVAEDHALLRQGLERMLPTAPDVELVGSAADLPSLLALVAETEPDVVVTDIRMPPTGTDEGIRLAAQLRAERPDVGVVVLSQHAEATYALALLADGSARRAYLLEGARRRRRRAPRRGPRGRRRRVAHRPAGGRPARQRRNGATPAPNSSRLTPRETEVLGEMAQGKSNGAIAASLVLSERAVEKHTNSIFSKLGLSEERDLNRRVKAVLMYLHEQGG